MEDIWTIARTPDPHWLVETVRHLPGAENQGRHHIFVDAIGPDGTDLRSTGLAVMYGWEGMEPEDPWPTSPIDKPPGEFGCHIPIFPSAVMRVAMHGAPSEVVQGLHTGFEDGEAGNNWGYQSFHVVFRYAPPPQAAPEPPKPKRGRNAALPAPAVAEPAKGPVPELVTGPVPELVTGPVPELVTGPVPELVTGPVPELVTGPVPELVEGPAPSAPTTWRLRNTPNSPHPYYTAAFPGGWTARITRSEHNQMYLAAILMPTNSARAAHTLFFFLLDDAMKWVEDKVAAMIAAPVTVTE